MSMYSECRHAMHPTLRALDEEVIACRLKFPGPRFLLPALIEEVGELAGAILTGNRVSIKKEAVQVACVAIRIAEEVDPIDYEKSMVVEAAMRLGEYVRCTIAKRHRDATGHMEHLGNIVDLLQAYKSMTSRQKDPCFAGRTEEEAKP